MDRIILGDNQFFGINHMSEEKGMAKLIRFQETKSIIDVIETAYECGVRAFTFSTHDQVQIICDHFRSNQEKYKDISLYPALPYAQKYAHSVNENGIVGTIKEYLLKDSSVGQVANMILKGGSAVLKKDPIEIMKLFIDMELKMFRGLNIKVIFLQNIVTDLILGFKIKEIFKAYVDFIENEYKCRAGFMTFNMPMLVDFLLECGIEDPVVCSSINKVGFQMNPDRETCIAALNKPFTAFAMSVMAAGSISPQEAFKYTAGIKNVKSIIFGASSKSHIEQAMELINKYSE